MQDLPEGNRACLYDTAHMSMVMNAMAKQAAALLHGCTKVAIIGVLRRGGSLGR